MREKNTAPINHLAGVFPDGVLGRPFRDGEPYNGGWIRIIPATAANVNLLVTHGLRALPRRAQVFDVSTNATFPAVVPRGATAWSTTQVSFNWPGSTQPVVLWIGG